MSYGKSDNNMSLPSNYDGYYDDIYIDKYTDAVINFLRRL